MRPMKGTLKQVFDLMQDAQGRTLYEIASALGISESSAGARLRDLRKPRFGGYTVERKTLATTKNVYTYRVTDAVRA